jgi:hypothetical protein
MRGLLVIAAVAAVVALLAEAPELASALAKSPSGEGVHTRLQQAEDFLNQADFQLGKADSDYGGHRSRALALVKEAVEEIRRGNEDGGGFYDGPIYKD